MTDEERNNPTNQEMERRSHDIYRVYNPLDVDFKFKYGGIWYKVPAKGFKEWEAFLAGHYFKKISESIIGQLIYEEGMGMIKGREEKGMSRFLNKYDENTEVWNNVPRMDNKELLQKIFVEVVIGLVEEFGSEPIPEEAQPTVKPSDLSVFDQIFADNSKRKAVASPEPLRPIIKKPLAEEITQDDS